LKLLDCVERRFELAQLRPRGGLVDRAEHTERLEPLDGNGGQLASCACLDRGLPQPRPRPLRAGGQARGLALSASA
jgi:hypothetical protein